MRAALDSTEPTLAQFVEADGVPDLSALDAYVTRTRHAAADAGRMCVVDEVRAGVFVLQLAPLRVELAAFLERRAARLLALVRAEVVGAIAAVRADAEATHGALRTLPESAEQLLALRETIERVRGGAYEQHAHARALSSLCAFLEAHGCELTPRQQMARWQVFGLEREMRTWMPKAHALFRRMRAELRDNFEIEAAQCATRAHELLDERGPAAADLDGLERAAEHYDVVRAVLDGVEWCRGAVERIDRHARLFDAAPVRRGAELDALRRRLEPRAELWDLAAEFANAHKATAAAFAREQRGALDALVRTFTADGADAASALRAALDLRAQFERVEQRVGTEEH